jgi:hypothetical protein
LYNAVFFYPYSDMREGPVPLEVTPLVWVFLSVLSIVILVTVVVGATFRVSAACSSRLRAAKDAGGGGGSRLKGHSAALGRHYQAANGGGGGGNVESNNDQQHDYHHCLKLSPEKGRNNPDIIQDTGREKC